MLAHDLCWRDHDKDFRCFAAFPVDELADLSFAVIRVGYQGNTSVEVVSGPAASGSGGFFFTLIDHGHMQVVRPRSRAG
eukprot:5724472-Heterocapsa_arctica.AAC.1